MNAIAEIFDPTVARYTTLFSQTVEQVFTPKPPFNRPKYAKLSESLLANLLGGMGFFYGDAKVDYSHAPEYTETNAKFWEEAECVKIRTGPSTVGFY
jgi:mannosyl-oligosaccharide glucosidase